VPAQVKGLTMTCSLDPKTPAEVLGDPRRLRQILVNLLQNAIKFTERGRIHFRMTMRPTTDDAYNLEFSIFDSGIGIAEDNLKKLFRPFAQADASITRRFGGTGLGLAITKSFVQLMGGDISVRSRPGLGSVFSFHINLKTTDRRTTLFAKLSTQILQKRRVLVLGGPGAQQRMIENLVRSWGMLPTVVQPGQPRTFAAYQETGYDIAILPVKEASDPSHPLFSWLSEPGRGAKLPVVWLGRKDSAVPAGCTAPSVYLGTLVDPVDLSQALCDLLTAVSAHSVHRGKKTDKPRPLAEILPLTILAAEDNATNREVIKLVLRNLGYRVDLVENGAEAVIAVKSKKYDLLLLDMQMPIMDGLTAAREICRLIPDATRRLKMIALTANALPGDREKCLDAGMDAYLTKPILPIDLAACLRGVFQPGQTAHPVAPQKMTASDGNQWLDNHHLEIITLGLQPEQALATLTQLHDSVCNDYKETLASVIECCEARDQVRFAETIHGLKGCFMMIGWARAGAFCADALAAARKGEFKDWQTFADKLAATFALSSKTMSAYLEGQRPNSEPASTSAAATPALCS
jgi:CheY-like chemotaxis protein